MEHESSHVLNVKLATWAVSSCIIYNVVMNCLSTWHFRTSIKDIQCRRLGSTIWGIFSFRKDVGMSTCKLLVLVYIHWTDREILAIKKFFAEDPY